MEIRHRSAIHTAAQSNIALFHSEPNIQLYFIYIQEIKLAQTKSQTPFTGKVPFVFLQIIPRKFLSHKYTNFISNKSPREYSFLFLSAFRPNYLPFGTKPNKKKRSGSHRLSLRYRFRKISIRGYRAFSMLRESRYSADPVQASCSNSPW